LGKRCKKARKKRVETLISNAIFCQPANNCRNPEEEGGQVSRDYAAGANRRHIADFRKLPKMPKLPGSPKLKAKPVDRI